MNRIIKISLYLLYALFIIVSFFLQFAPGKEIALNFFTFAFSMIKVVPVAFVLIGLFEVWVKKETIEKHLGEKSSWKAYFWIILLSSTVVGGMYVAFPVAASLYKKGARLGVIFAYLSAAAVFRVPMAIFEASFLGIKFTMIRFLVSLPIIIISSELLGDFLEKSKLKNSMFREDG